MKTLFFLLFFSSFVNAQTKLLSGSPLNLSGGYTLTLTETANTNVTLPTSGTLLTANQTITLGTDLSGSGTTTLNATIVNNAITTSKINNSAVTLAKIANIADQTILGNNTGGSAAPVALTASQTKTVLAIANTDVSGLGTLSTQSGTFSGTSSGTNTGDVTLAGENYLSRSSQVITANAVNLSGTNVTSTLPETKGGTNQSTYATGNTLYASATNTLSKLAVGSTGQVLTVASGIPSWATPTFSGGLTVTTMDLTTNGYTIKDTVPGNILIAGTTKPGSATFSYTVVTADIPTNTVVYDWMVFVTIGGKNTDAVNSRTINWRLTINGTDKGAADASIACPTATPWWKIAVSYVSAQIAVGDVIGFKLWASATNQIDFRYATIYVVPRMYGVSTGLLGGALAASTSQATLAGANAGVTYTATNLGSTPQFYDVGVATLIGGLVTGQVFLFGSPERVYQLNSLSDNNNISSAVTAGSQLVGVGTATNLFRYLYWYH